MPQVAISKTFYINFVGKAIVARDISFFDNIYFSYLHFLHLNLSLWARLYLQHFPIFHITHVKNIYSLQIQDIFVPLPIEKKVLKVFPTGRVNCILQLIMFCLFCLGFSDSMSTLLLFADMQTHSNLIKFFYSTSNCFQKFSTFL